MFGFGKRQEQPAGPRVSTRLCTDTFNGKYPHVGLYDTRERKIWVCKPLSGQAIRTSHARLITGADNPPTPAPSTPAPPARKTALPGIGSSRRRPGEGRSTAIPTNGKKDNCWCAS